MGIADPQDTGTVSDTGTETLGANDMIRNVVVDAQTERALDEAGELARLENEGRRKEAARRQQLERGKQLAESDLARARRYGLLPPGVTNWAAVEWATRQIRERLRDAALGGSDYIPPTRPPEE